MIKKNIKEVSDMIRQISIIVVVLSVTMTGLLQAYGTGSGAIITNMTVSNAQVATNLADPGTLSASFTNDAGIVNLGFIQGAKVRTTVTPGYDLSLVRFSTAMTNLSAVAGSFVTFDGIVTNFGNVTDPIVFKVSNIYTSVGWVGVNSYTLYTNGTPIGAATTGVDFTMPGVPAMGIVPFSIRLDVPMTALNGASNVFQVIVQNTAAPAGDTWPGAGAIAPATADTVNARDRQVYTLLASVQGPVLHLSKVADVNNARPYEYITYTISYTNVGSASALGVRIFDNIPSNTTNISGMSNSHMAGAWVANGTTPTTRQVRFTPNAGTIPAGEHGLVKFTVQVK